MAHVPEQVGSTMPRPTAGGTRGRFTKSGGRSSQQDAPGDAAGKRLESLTPHYEERDHGTYLRRLEEAVKDPDNLNIALTGRYGAGKSSVLNQFEADHRRTVLRLAISSLAPGEPGESTTNRIQKEIVKQLLYGASEKVGKNSRFSKIAVLSTTRALAQSAAVVLAAGGLLYLLGVLPHIKWTGPKDPTWHRVTAWAVAFALVTALVAVVRVLTHGRFTPTQVSAAGAAVTLTEKPQTFFDKYLDEIVHFFGRESKGIVIFEDLDRFNDPNIFEALRELNVLLNETPERRRKRRGNAAGRTVRWLLGKANDSWPGRLAAWLPYPWAGRLLGLGQPLRFIYAVRDSVFHRIETQPSTRTTAGAAATGAVTATGGGADDRAMAAETDEAAAETLRANRTKFFDIVIPLVPFISHRNARDLLTTLLQDRGITGIEPRLVNTVARHCTDMRLMRNMCNEYLVFAERLLQPAPPRTAAPGLTPSHLFALVAYKNFHLADFEKITRRDSDLDRLYDLHQRLVRDTIAQHDRRKRTLTERTQVAQTRAGLAETLGRRLLRYADMARLGLAYTELNFEIGSESFDRNDVTGYEFWAAVAREQQISIEVTSGSRPTYSQHVDTLGRDALEDLVAESLEADRWADLDTEALDAELAGIERDIEILRRADFGDLTKLDRFTLSATVEGGLVSIEPGKHTFAELVTCTLKSDLARALVRDGYVDRNFTLYVAQFYGNFTGVDVANFMVQHVQTNTSATDYNLARTGAVANLLVEAENAGEDLLSSAAALNVDILNHLLVTGHPGLEQVIDQITTSWPGDAARSFLAAFFTAERGEGDRLAAQLAQRGWRHVFTYLVRDEDVPADKRVGLVNAALSGHDLNAVYDLDRDVRAFIRTDYKLMNELAVTPSTGGTDAEAQATQGTQPTSSGSVMVFLRRAKVVFPTVAPLRAGILEHVVEEGRYELTAVNLRVACGLSSSDDISLETLSARHMAVYQFCLNNLPAYFSALDDDSHTAVAISTADGLKNVMTSLAEDRGRGAGIPALLARTAPAAALLDLSDAPDQMWAALAEAHLFRASLSNLELYLNHAGGAVDGHLAGVLAKAGRVATDEPGDTTHPDGSESDRIGAAVAVLNASEHLTTEERTSLAASIDPPIPLPLDGIAPTADDLFARMLERGLVDDDTATFEHLRAGDWVALGPAIKVSHQAGTAFSPDLLSGMVGPALADPATASKVADVILSDVDSYVPEEDWAELEAVANYARGQRKSLTPKLVSRIAAAGHEAGSRRTDLVLSLLVDASPAADASEIVAVWQYLGDFYRRVAVPGSTFDLPLSETHNTLLRVLHSEGRITRGYPKRPKRYSVTVL